MIAKSNKTIVQIIANSHAHRRHFMSILVQPEARSVARIFKGPVAAIEVEIAQRGVVGHQQVDFAVVVHIDKNRREAIVPFGLSETPALTLTSVNVPSPLL